MIDTRTPVEKICEELLKLRAEKQRLLDIIDVLEEEISKLRKEAPEVADEFMIESLNQLMTIDGRIGAIQMSHRYNIGDFQ